MPSTPPLLLRCPVCGGPLHGSDNADVSRRALVCGSGHSFDAARQGYFNLLVGKGTVFEADSAEMVASRFNFLDAGHYRALAEAVAGTIARMVPPRGEFTVLDSGTGTGQYLRVVLDEVKRTTEGCTAVALDISKFALRRAARINPEALCLVCDVWQPLPLVDAAVDVVMVIFAPRNAAEFARVLRPGGRLVVVTPRAGHLAAVASSTGMLSIEDDKDTRLAGSLAPHFVADSAQDIDIRMMLTPAEIADLAFMGPAGHHLDRAALASGLGTGDAATAVDAMFRITVFRPATDAS